MLRRFLRRRWRKGVHHPFAVGVNEGAASVDGVGGWILAQESGFYRLLTGAIRAVKESGSAAWMLAALSFGYGVFHAAGPGHGKAVIASYMVANERVLRRGLDHLPRRRAAAGPRRRRPRRHGVPHPRHDREAHDGGRQLDRDRELRRRDHPRRRLFASKGAAVAAAWRQRPRSAGDLAFSAFGPLQAAGGRMQTAGANSSPTTAARPSMVLAAAIFMRPIRPRSRPDFRGGKLR